MARFGRDEVGAWALKSNPVNWDPPGQPPGGGSAMKERCVRENVRARAMAPGDPVVLWVSGTGRVVPRGVWGTGTVTSPAHAQARAGADARLHVGVDLAASRLLVSFKAVATDAVLRRSELIAAPQMSNPAMLTIPEWEALRRLLAAVDAS